MRAQRVLTVILIGLAFLSGFLASLYVRKEKPVFVEVLVARKQLEAWTKLEHPEELFKRVAYRVGEEPQDAVKPDEIKLKEHLIARSLRENELLKLGSLVGEQAPRKLFTFTEDPNKEATWLLRQGMDVVVFVYSVPNSEKPTRGLFVSQFDIVPAMWCVFGFSPGASLFSLDVLP